MGNSFHHRRWSPSLEDGGALSVAKRQLSQRASHLQTRHGQVEDNPSVACATSPFTQGSHGRSEPLPYGLRGLEFDEVYCFVYSFHHHRWSPSLEREVRMNLTIPCNNHKKLCGRPMVAPTVLRLLGFAVVGWLTRLCN